MSIQSEYPLRGARFQPKPCSGDCGRRITVDTGRMDSYRAVCPKCADKLEGGQLDTITFYRPTK